jgi:hypothetical protein
MEKLTLEEITELQKQYGLKQTQDWINSGICWLLEGAVGRHAWDTLESGACMLPNEEHKDYYGNPIPSREDVKATTRGSLENSQLFWQGVMEGSIELGMPDDE